MRPRDAIIAVLAGTGLLLAVQAAKARRQLGAQIRDIVPDVELDGQIRLVFMGDSLSVGLGADKYMDTPGYIVANHLKAKYLNIAECGAVSRDLPRQSRTAIAFRPDIVVMFIGTNDITRGKSMRAGTKYLSEAVQALVDSGAVVYVVPCVDLSIVRSIGNPLRSVLGGVSRQYGRLQQLRAEQLGAIVINPQPIHKHFCSDDMFAADMFHPSSKAYKIIAEHIIEALEG